MSTDSLFTIDIQKKIKRKLSGIRIIAEMVGIYPNVRVKKITAKFM